jgi:MoxR-like ATPase
VVTAKLTTTQVHELHALVKQVVIPEDVEDAMLDICDELSRSHGIIVSDRRLRSMMGLLRARAVLNGRMTVTKRDLVVLADSLWHRHEQRSDILSTVLSVAAPSLAAAQKIADAALEVFNSISDYRSEPNLESKLAQVQNMEDQLRELDPGDDADITALIEQVRDCRKGIARGFAQVSGLLRALAQ